MFNFPLVENNSLKKWASIYIQSLKDYYFPPSYII